MMNTIAIIDGPSTDELCQYESFRMDGSEADFEFLLPNGKICNIHVINVEKSKLRKNSFQLTGYCIIADSQTLQIPRTYPRTHKFSASYNAKKRKGKINLYPLQTSRPGF